MSRSALVALVIANLFITRLLPGLGADALNRLFEHHRLAAEPPSA